MPNNPKIREEVLRKLAYIRMELIETVLGAAVDREADVDLYLKWNEDKKRRLKNFISGLSVIYLFSFMQSHVEENQWEDIKSPSGKQRALFKNVDFDCFDVFKYVRDCFAHDWEGSMFPKTQSNTIYFLQIINSGKNPTSVKIECDNIILDESATFDCLQVIISVLEEANITL